jgi:hypothetical protein
MLVHGAIQTSDVSFDFLNSKTLEVKLAWPEWFTFAELMSELTADDEGNIAFPPEHAMTMDMSERNAALIEEGNRVYDYGYFQFQQDMVQNIDTFELLNIPIQSLDISARMLQFYVEVAATPVQSHQCITHERTANLGTGQRPTPRNARTAPARESKGNGEADDGTGDQQMGNDNNTGGGVGQAFRNVRNRML